MVSEQDLQMVIQKRNLTLLRQPQWQTSHTFIVLPRFGEPQVTGSNPVIGSSLEGFQGCHAVASMKAHRLIP